MICLQGGTCIGNNQKLQRGSALVSVMAGVALLSVTMFSSMAYIDFLTTQNASLKRDFSISLVKSNILRTLQSPSAWMNTINDDANLFKSCTADPVNCLAVKNFVPLNIHDIEDKILVTGTQGTWYDHAGKLCTGEGCPVLVTSQWKGVCNSEGTCTQVYVELDFQTRDKNGTQSKSKVGFLKNYFIGTTQKTLTTSVTFTSGDVSNATAKIVVILDSSESMIDNFAKVKSGLSGIMTKLVGKAVEVYFYTTAATEPNGDINYANASAIKLYYDDTYSEYVGHKKVASYVVTKDDDITYNSRLAMDMSRKMGLTIDPSLDIVTIQSRLDSLFATYVAAYGTDKESGLCTLHRVLTDEGPNKIIGTNDLAFFIIVSDEDDIMLSSAALKYNCHKTQKAEWTTYTTDVPKSCDPATELCDMASGRVTFSGKSAVAYYASKINDTIQNPYLYLCSLNSNQSAPGYSPCPYQTIGTYPCSEKDLQAINPDGTKMIIDCRVQVTDSDTTASISSTSQTGMANLQANFCTGGSFVLNGTNYLNLQDYVTRYYQNGYASATITSCEVSFTKRVPTEFSSYKTISYTRMNGDVTTTNWITSDEKLKIRDHIVATLKTKFGETGFGVKAFIQDPIKDLGLCALTDGTYGIAYVNFINMLNNPYSGYESICNDTYNFSFDTLGNNILSTMNNTYIFSSLTSTDKIIGISITRVGSSFTLSPDQYEVVVNKVIFKEGTLQAEDQITLILADQTSGTWVGP